MALIFKQMRMCRKPEQNDYHPPPSLSLFFCFSPLSFSGAEMEPSSRFLMAWRQHLANGHEVLSL